MQPIINQQLYESILRYYVEAGLDYQDWSKNFNMHFGFGNLKYLFCREKMLNRMTDEVFKKLGLSCTLPQRVADFGCGVGASMRRGADSYRQSEFTGVTIVPWQKEKGELLTDEEVYNNRVNFLVEDYHATSLPPETFDGLYAIESACYSPAELRERLVKEMFRVLKRGGKVVIADGFRKKEVSAMRPSVQKIYQGICRNWALPGMMHIEELADLFKRTGFRDVQCENISWRVAPSVAHVPFVIAKFMLKKKLKGEKLLPQSIRNLKGSFQTLLLGLRQRDFGYYLVTAQK
jgi:MPBQ/MSBQ methyltransferase